MASLSETTTIEKSASVTGVTATVNVSDELSNLLVKKASEDLTKKASEEGAQLAKELMSKIANEINLQNGITQAQQATAVTPNGEGSVSEVLNETLQKAVASGAEPEDKADEIFDGKGSVDTGVINTPNKAEPEVESNEQEKQASLNNKENTMASLADLILEKLAAETEVAGQLPVNNLQIDNHIMDAQATAKVQPTPGSEEGGSVNQIFEAIVARAQASGAGSDNLVGDAGNTAAEGSGATGVPVSKEDETGEAGEGAAHEEQEKVAAVNALVDAGYDFDSAVSLVKQAEEALAAESVGLQKKAAFEALIAKGVDFDSAIAMIKQAEADIALGDSIEMQKQAAFKALVADGIDFDTAAALVKQAEADLTAKA